MKKLIVVLAHPRTGSSLLMQTLKLLNIGIIGQFERKNLPQQANPKGYYEDMDILGKGLTDRAIEKIEQDPNEILAVKIALKGMMRYDRVNQWRYLQGQQATILVPIRPPLESAVSRLIFTRRHNEMARFISITTFLREYQLQYKTLSKILLTQVPELLPTTFTIDFHTALHTPGKYVQSIIEHARLSVSELQFKEAQDNIDPELYRNNESSFENNVKEWHRKIGSEQFYDILTEQESPWQMISDFPLYGIS